jgi:cell division septation protein DedD
MDRALKERVIGAIVLVIFAVLVVPVFLNGPSTDTEIISESVTLPGQNDEGTRQQRVVLKRNRTQPVPQSLAEVKTEPTAQSKTPAESTPDVREKTPESTASKSIEARPASTQLTGMWAVQMGSFSEKVNAERLVADLGDDGFAAFMSQLSTSSGDLHRVRIGPQKDRASAESIAAQLHKAGHKGQVVTHP